jgi:hypothetical protein
MYAVRLLAAVALATTLTASRAMAQHADTAITLTNQDGAVRRFTIADLRALPQIEVKIDGNDGGPMVERGPSLRALLTLGGAPAGQMLRGPSMLLVIVAEGSDGYKVAYTLAELDEQFGARDGIIALSENGKPLADNDGPLRIVIGAESHRARWIRHLVALRIVRVG